MEYILLEIESLNHDIIVNIYSLNSHNIIFIL